MSLTIRERFLAVMRFELDVRPPMWEFGYWAAAVRRWYQEGLERNQGLSSQIPGGKGVGGSFPKKDLPADDVDVAVELEEPMLKIPVETWIFPRFQEKIIEIQDDGSKILIDEMGIKKRIGRDDDSIPEYQAWPIKNKEDWEEFKYMRLNPKTPGRYPENISFLIDEYKQRSYPLTMGTSPVGFFGSLRYLMGEVNLFMAYYDQPDLIRNIIDYLVDFWIDLFAPILEKVTLDCFHMWEDMCYKTGSLISPLFFREFMLPAYKKFTSFLKDFNVKNIICDTDGYCWELIPLFLEGGITGLYPMEAAANMDITKVREAFPKLQITGGLDKRCLLGGRKDIEEELMNKVPAMLKKGGYIPHIDHNMPPDVSWENFKYYRILLKKILMKNKASK